MDLHCGVSSLDGRVLRKDGRSCKKGFKKINQPKVTIVCSVANCYQGSQAVVNARPLVYVGGDIDSSITLSPRHFLSLIPDTGIPEVEASTNDLDYNPYESTAGRLLQLWKKGQRLLDMSWKIWRDKYLLSLRERTQSVLKSRRIESYYSTKVDDVVLIQDNVPRGCWKVGKVVSLVSSLDGCVRSAKVSLSSGRVIARPLNLHY